MSLISDLHPPARSSSSTIGSTPRSPRPQYIQRRRCKPRAQLQRDDPAGVPRSLFIFGLGYTTVALARAVQQHQWTVTSTARRPSRFKDIAAPPPHRVVRYDPAAGVQLSCEALQLLECASHVVTCIPPLGPKLYDPVLRSQLDLLRWRCAPEQPPLQWFGYLSSTGVYGDWHGQWVDERSETKATTSRGLVRLEHERAWQQLQRDTGLPLHLFRLGGIYGPRRSVLEALAKGAAGHSSSRERRSRQRYTARIHVADICSVLLASMAAPQPTGGIWNVVDDEPAPRRDVEEYAAQLLHMDAGKRGPHLPNGSSSDTTAQSSGDLGQSSRIGALEEKRVSNTRMKELLGRPLQFPSYREGVAALVAADLRPFKMADLQCLFGAG